MRPIGQRAFHRGNDRILGGVCGGMASGFHIDALWVRLAFVLLAFFQGIGLFIYIVLWLVMPEETEGGGSRSGFDSMADDLRRVGTELRGQFSGQADSGAPRSALGSQAVVLGVVLVILGLVLLGVNTGVVTWTVMWPVAVIAIGLGFLLRGFGRRT
jgi:phage shock protein C